MEGPLRHTLAVTILLTSCTALTGLDKLDENGARSRAHDDDATTTGGGDGGGGGGVLVPTTGSSGGSSGGPTDSGTPVPVTPDSAPIGWCAARTPAPTLCADFDDDVLPFEPKIVAPGVVAIDTAVARSGSRSVFLDVPSAGGRAWLKKQMPAPARSSITLGFSVKVSAVDVGMADYEVGVIKLGAYELQLERLSTGELNVEEEQPLIDGGSTETNTPIGITLPLDTWKQIEIRLQLGTNASSLNVAVEGTPTPYTRSLSAHLYAENAPNIQLGYDGIATLTKVHFDDVVVDVR